MEEIAILAHTLKRAVNYWKYYHCKFAGILINSPITHKKVYLCAAVTDFRNH